MKLNVTKLTDPAQSCALEHCGTTELLGAPSGAGKKITIADIRIRTSRSLFSIIMCFQATLSDLGDRQNFISSAIITAT